MPQARAKLLYKAGYKSLQKLAAAEPRLLASDIEHLTQAQVLQSLLSLSLSQSNVKRLN